MLLKVTLFLFIVYSSDIMSRYSRARLNSQSSSSDFEVLSRLGSGSFGIVFKVRRETDNNIYVMKCVRISELSHQEQVNGFSIYRQIF